MTYFGFLALFLGLPILLLLLITWWDRRRGLTPASLAAHAALPVVLLHVLIALVYTTPWDNYLVATRVWWYDPELVTGFTIGWVPIEEYTFFIVQPIFTSLWLLFLARRSPPPSSPFRDGAGFRQASVTVLGALWLLSLVILFIDWEPGTYIGLELAWALPPIMLQLFYGADILWHHRRLVLLALLPPTLYLSAADALAIGAGTWTINPEQSLGLYLGGILPVEELLFFLLTNTLIIFGVTLTLAQESRRRFLSFKKTLAPLTGRLSKSGD